MITACRQIQFWEDISHEMLVFNLFSFGFGRHLAQNAAFINSVTYQFLEEVFNEMRFSEIAGALSASKCCVFRAKCQGKGCQGKERCQERNVTGKRCQAKDVCQGKTRCEMSRAVKMSNIQRRHLDEVSRAVNSSSHHACQSPNRDTVSPELRVAL